MMRWLGVIDRAQKSRAFKIGATIVIVVAAIAVYVASIVQRHAADDPLGSAPPPAVSAPDSEHAAGDDAASAAPAAGDATARLIDSIIDRRAGGGSVPLLVIGVAGVLLVFVWLGLGVTALALLGLAWAIGLTLLRRDSTQSFAVLLLGVVMLAMSFTAFFAVLRIVFSIPGAAFAIARNVVIEAVRLKVSIVLIVALVLLLAALPGILDPEQPLRYRVQTFLSWSTGGAFWLVALLTILLAVSSVTGEQRDRVIWQTMTKPVAHWQYLLGKWLGVSGVAAALLGVCSTGIFAFTEHLRMQPAQGESVAYIADGGAISQDRYILETQVLTARRGVEPDLAAIGLTRDSEQFQANLRAYVEDYRLKNNNPSFATTSDELAKVERDLFESEVKNYRSIAPADGREYIFTGLRSLRESGGAPTLRYRIDGGTNRPDEFYRITFIVGASEPVVRDVALGHGQTLLLAPGAVEADGTLRVSVLNGDIYAQTPNASSISLPKGTFEITFSAGSYRWNFLRITLVLWLKLAVLAMLGVCASTFLSFPVAAMLSIGTFLIAEGASFLSGAVEQYSYLDDHRKVVYWKTVIWGISKVVSELFSAYASLKPVERLTDGRMLSWGDLVGGTSVLALGTVVLFVIALIAFRRRELATYSGS
ncbi:MAG: hypothetical protein RBS39_05580 [Phycisphaerales bacterium]|jgi:ABC-type transport system involved in multi-copper enzyme maturation permease subunit|nr:hypothetical protein [Phycisphaerales bacterium]